MLIHRSNLTHFANAIPFGNDYFAVFDDGDSDTRDFECFLNALHIGIQILGRCLSFEDECSTQEYDNDKEEDSIKRFHAYAFLEHDVIAGMIPRHCPGRGLKRGPELKRFGTTGFRACHPDMVLVGV